MSRLCIYNLVLLIVFVGENAFSQTYYYSLTKKFENGTWHTNTIGGQFITFDGDVCYDSDKYGISVGNGRLTYQKQYSNSSKTYIGNSYFGNTIYRFKSDLSVLNIVVNKNLIYVYKRATPPSNQTTCSLIRKKKSTGSSASTPAQQWNNNYYNGTATSNENKTPDASRQKTKVRKDCAYCSGKGELIQHEYVSTFGVSGPRVYCNKCNQSWNYGTVHEHHRCNHCGGTGYYEYEY